MEKLNVDRLCLALEIEIQVNLGKIKYISPYFQSSLSRCIRAGNGLDAGNELGLVTFF